jgi:molybdopterin-guanine dinucleotide biosynthesis protein A
MINAMKDVSAFVVAGGKSSRMGQDKALLKLNGRTLLDRALELAREVSPDVRIVGSAQKFAAFAPVIEDVFTDQGPLAAIHAALESSGTDLNLVLAVDLPFLDPNFLQYLIAQGQATNALVTVPRAAGGWQTLCAVYRRGFADYAERSLREGKNKIDPLFARVETRVIEENELLQHGFSPDIFQNLNTPEEFKKAQKQTRPATSN